MKITNTGKGSLIMTLAGRSIEISPGETATLSKAEQASFHANPVIKGWIKDGALKVGGDKDGDGKPDKEPKPVTVTDPKATAPGA